MKNYKTELVLQQNRLKKSLSIKSKLAKLKQEPQSPAHKHQKQIKMQYQVPEVNKLLEQFEKQIKKSIEFHLDVLASRSLPKCISHNNIQTLYCTNDRKPLCVNCLYLNNAHKPHKVVPLQKASHQIQGNIKEGVDIINRKLQECDKIKQANQEYLEKAQKDLPVVIQKIHNFYLNFHELLVRKKNTQIQQISQFWSKIRHTYHFRNTHIVNMKNYIKFQLQNTKQQSSQSSALHTRNVIVQLAKIENILQKQLSQEKVNHFAEDLKKFQQIQDAVQKQMTLQSNVEQAKSKNQYGLSSTRKSPKSPSAEKAKNMCSFKSSNDKKKAHNKEEVAKESQRTLATSQRKNRHSKSDLLSKSQILERRKSQEKTLSKAKNHEFLIKIQLKTEKSKSKLQMPSPIKDKKFKSTAKNDSK